MSIVEFVVGLGIGASGAFVGTLYMVKKFPALQEALGLQSRPQK